MVCPDDCPATSPSKTRKGPFLHGRPYSGDTEWLNFVEGRTSVPGGEGSRRSRTQETHGCFQRRFLTGHVGGQAYPS